MIVDGEKEAYDAFSFGLALLERMFVLELGSHFGGLSGLLRTVVVLCLGFRVV
jgi:hypothetical protein